MEYELEKRIIDFDCAVHGVSQVEVLRVHGLSGDWLGARCAACFEDKKRLESKRESFLQRENEQQELARKLLASGIPLLFKGKGFDDYIPQNDVAQSNLNLLREYAENFPEMERKGRPILMIGTTGTGKSHLANSIIDTVIRKHGKTAMIVNAWVALASVKKTLSGRTKIDLEDAVKKYIAPNLLALDECGASLGTKAERDIFAAIVNGRHEMRKPTIMMSNYAIPMLMKYVGEMAVDRMKENDGLICVFNWESYRGKA